MKKKLLFSIGEFSMKTFLPKAVIFGALLFILMFNSLIISTDNYDITLSKLSSSAQPALIEYQKLEWACFDRAGFPNGSLARVCYEGGTLSSCITQSCPEN